MRASKTWLFSCDVLLQRALARRHLRQLGDALADVEEVLKLSRRYRMNLSIAEALILKSHLLLEITNPSSHGVRRTLRSLPLIITPVALPPHCSGRVSLMSGGH